LPDAPLPPGAPPLDRRGLALLALVFLALELAVIRQYGWFRDEFYYLVCADHLAAGYVDQPPLSIWIIAAWKRLLGESLVVVRLLPALVGAACVFLAGEFARTLGGDRWAQRLAALAMIAAPVYLGTHHVFSMNTFDALLWLLAMRAVLAAVERPGRWPLVGLVLGLGLLNKLSVLWLGAGLLGGLLAARERRALLTRGPWLAAIIALVLAAPFVLWQAQHDWPTVEFIRHATGEKMKVVPWQEFVVEQLLSMNVVSAPLWLGGLVWAFASKQGRRALPFAVTLLVVAVILLAAGRSRGNYLVPAYPPMLAAGAVALEGMLRSRGRLLHALPFAVLALGTLPWLPFALPVLPVERYIAYAKAMGMAPSTDENKEVGPLSQHYADMHGWQELTDLVVRAWETLTPDERARAAIFGQNYGEAGSVTVLGRRRGLPEAISGHNSFWHWGPPKQADGSVVVIIGGEEVDHSESFASVIAIGALDAPLAMPYERGLTVFVGRGLRRTLAEAWGRVRHYD
jgi:hypothetical protein